MRNSETKWAHYFNLPNPGLRSYFERVRNGNEDEYRTPFYHGKSPTQIVEEWKNYLVEVRKEWPSLWEFENDLAKKVGPMSIMAPLSARMKDIDSYYDLISTDQESISDDAISAVVKEWSQVRGLRVRSVDRTVELMKKSTNSGSPYFSKRDVVTHKTIPCTCTLDFPTCYQNLNGDIWNACAVLGWRGQEGGPKPEDVKQRVVWMFPYAVNISELQVYQPLIESAQRYNLVPAWVSMDNVDRSITRMFDSKDSKDLVICTDFSKFDQHFGKACQDAAYTIFSRILTPNSQSESWLRNVFPIKYGIPLAYDYGKIRTGWHGMGSGSGGTNADETLVHRALQYESAMSMSKVLNPNSQCLGDDGVLTFPGCTAEDVMRSYTRHGLEMNPDKQYVSTQDCTYLRRWHHQNYRVDGVCVGVYSSCRALGRLAEQERYYDPEVWGPKMVALRQLSIIENVKWHPLRERFADFCMKGDKYKLGIDIPGFLDNIGAIAQEAIEYMPDFLGYTKSQQKEADSGIENWWIVQYLKSKA